MISTDLDVTLDEDYLFILNFCKPYFGCFKDNAEYNSLTKQWISKLSCEIYNGVTARRIRNMYLVRLVECLQNRILIEPFLKYPPNGNLEPLEVVDRTDQEAMWLQELIEVGNQKHSLCDDHRAYLRTKVFDGNVGACAYLAVSIADQGHPPEWTKMGTDEEFEEHLDAMFDRIHNDGEPFANSNKSNDIQKFLIEAIKSELSGNSQPGQCQELEKIITRYKIEIRNSEFEQITCGLTGSHLRNYLLLQLQNQLINDVCSR